MNDTGRLVLARQSPHLVETLWRMVREAKGDDVLAPVTVVGPTRYANLSLRQELGRSGFANVRFIVLPVLSELLGGAAMARAGRKPLTSILEGVYIRAGLSGATGPLAPVRDHSSTQVSVRSSFRELRKVDEEVLARLEEKGGVRGELVSLYRSFRESTSADRYDVEDLTEAAADAVNRGDTPGLDDLGLIIFYLPRRITPAESRLIEALSQQERCAVILGTTGDDLADEETEKLSQKLQPVLGDPGPAGTDNSDLLPGKSRLHIGPNAHEELRWVIRQMVEEARENRTPFHRTAVLYRTENPYGSLIRDELKLAGIPSAGPGRDSLGDSAVGRTLTGALKLADGKLRRADVMEWLTECPICPPAGRYPGFDSRRFNPSRWDSLTRKAGIVAGLEQWRSRLHSFANDREMDAARAEKSDDTSPARISYLRREARSARDALAFIDQLDLDISKHRECRTWEEFCSWAGGLLDSYLDHGIPEFEQAAEERIRRVLEEIKAADSIDNATTLEVFRQTVEESLQAPLGHLGVTGQGVFVSSFSAAAGMNFDAVWLVGMIEGGTPPAVRPDPLLPEADWRAAGGESRREQRVASERYDYLSAIATAPRRVLSYPAADASSQREAFPSRWFLEQASALEGKAIHTGDLPSLRGREWFTVNDSALQALSDVTDGALADPHDYNLRRLLQWKDAGLRISRHPMVQQGNLARATRLARRRNQHSLTEFDGNLSGIASEAKYVSRLKETPVSATSLESWAVCPYRYFLGHVLRLSGLESPDQITSISALERGILVHDILERFIKETVEANELPAPGEAWDDAGRRRLTLVAEDEFQQAETRGVTGKPLLWELTKQDVRDDLEIFLEEEEKLRARHGTTQLQVEAEFGLGGESPEVEDTGIQLKFRGRIDRIDLAEDGASALVIDYKTGNARPFDAMSKDIIDQGKRLQLGVYSLAARELVPGATNVLAAYWFATTRGGFRFAPANYFDIGDREVGDRFRQGVATIISGISGGVFPANPGPPGQNGPVNCQYCDFNSLCPSRRMDSWEHKKTDGMVSGYLSLSAAEEEETQ